MNKSLQRRLRVFSAVVVLVAVMLSARLAWLQIYNYEYYYARAETNRERKLQINATRGEIFDVHGELLASNRPGFAVSILDLSSRDASQVIAYLSDLLEMDEEEITQRIYEARYRKFAPIRLATDVSPEIVAKIEERRLDLPGVIIETLPVRHYEYDSLAAHVLGYVGAISPEQKKQADAQNVYYHVTDYHGQSGVELTWEQYLRGKDGILSVEVNSYGRRTRVLDREEPEAGHDLHLTLDARLQEISERVLAEIFEQLQENGNTQAEKGAVVAIDPHTGGILAMVSYPAYNPNKITKDSVFYNRAIQGGYPVGSTYKMVGAMGALEEELITERSIVTCTGSRRFFRYEDPRGCYGGTVHGSLNVVSALAKSCNIFFFEMGQRLGAERLYDYGESFGFSRLTGLLDLQGEREGSLESRTGGYILNAAIGQGHVITPLQLANYGAILANGGTRYRPYLVQRAVDHTGSVVIETEPEIMDQLEYSEKNWDIVKKGMEAVTMPGGTASIMRDLPVKVAAKTGSAQAGEGIISHSLFVGYAPAEAPAIAIAVIVERGGLGSQGAVPVANRILAEYYAPPVEEEAENPVLGPTSGPENE
ncbi:MAG: penicillin-binding protein 2 [Bacillota bacterium]|nr:penicillin-binding protein 2 [Bacillota bacterium]MDW7683315.1 penicillin-binding protein 2 [Bacillota bacterium]